MHGSVWRGRSLALHQEMGAVAKQSRMHQSKHAAKRRVAAAALGDRHMQHLLPLTPGRLCICAVCSCSCMSIGGRRRAVGAVVVGGGNGGHRQICWNCGCGNGIKDTAYELLDLVQRPVKGAHKVQGGIGREVPAPPEVHQLLSGPLGHLWASSSLANHCQCGRDR